MAGDFDLNPADYAADQEAPELVIISQVAQAFKPGSQRAYERGCTCPRIDNAYGRGVQTSLLTVLWFRDPACPYHVPSAPAAEPGE